MSTAKCNGFWVAGARAAEREERSNDQIKRGEKLKKASQKNEGLEKRSL
jgi:hypothetical protein